MQLGPISRHPAVRTFSSSARSSARPSAPASPNPALITQIAPTPFARQSSTVSNTRAAGTATIARSTALGYIDHARVRAHALDLAPPWGGSAPPSR